MSDTSRAVRVIVAAYQQVDALRLTLRGYLRQSSRDFALTVADDGSSDGTGALVAELAALARERDLSFEHVHQPDRGFRKNRVLNEAVRRSQGEGLLLFTDADCVPPQRFVERHLAVHEPWSFHVGGAVRLTQAASARLDEDAIDRGDHEGLTTAADRRDLAKRARKSRWGTLLRRRNRPKVLGLNMAFDRALLEALNGFDERFESWGLGEDSDLRDRAMRLRPRPRVKVLYGINDVVHLWHPRGTGGREASRRYYDTPRPVRCERGLDVADDGR